MIIRKSYLKQLKEQSSHILDDVKSVNIGNEMAVTLSIGIGLNSDRLMFRVMNYARIAIDMALARGGDQAVIKNCNSVTYIGGKVSRWRRIPV